MNLNEFKFVGLASDLVEGGDALVFDIDTANFITGFVIKYQGAIYAYRNQCPHNGSQLDWMPGKVLDQSGQNLVCATHGALFRPENGVCIAGPCINQRLIGMKVRLENDHIFISHQPNL